jgi:hypothetical protein
MGEMLAAKQMFISGGKAILYNCPFGKISISRGKFINLRITLMHGFDRRSP